MAQKVVIQFSVLVATFLATWLGLSQVEFVQPEDVNSLSRASERKLGEMILESVRKGDEEIVGEDINAIIDTIARRICLTNQIILDSIQIHVIVNAEVNAFTLPDKQMVVYTGLISRTKNAEELAGVLAHEIAHMEKNHVMKKLVREVGLAMLFVLLDGGKHYEIINEVTRILSSSAFSRKQESEADKFAAEALAKADIDPENLANFLFRFSQKTKVPEELVWLSTHPNSEDRAAEIVKMKKDLTFTPKPIISTSWDKVREWVVKDADED